MQRGMVRTAFSVCSVVLTLILGAVVNPYVSGFLTEKTPVYDTVQEKCKESISGALEEQLEQQTDKEKQEQFIQELPLPENLKDILIKNNTEQGYNHLVAQSFGEYLSHSIAQMAVGAISLIFTFVLISIAMNILCGVLNSVFSLPVLSFINRMGGAGLGIIQGIFFVWLVFLIITLFWDAAWAKEAAELVQENSLTKYLYDHNILLHFLSALL